MVGSAVFDPDGGTRITKLPSRKDPQLAEIATELRKIRIILEKATGENGDPPPKRGLTLAEMQEQAREAVRGARS